jgi:transcriptional regulator with XRE-family HTH domain
MRQRRNLGPHPVDIHVGLRLRQRRTALGRSQPKLAAALGIAYQQLYKYEQAKNRISASRLYHLSKALDVPVTFFFEGITPDTSTTVPGPPAINEQTDPLDTAEAAELLAAYNALQDPMMRRLLLDLARALATGPNEAPANAGRSRRRNGSRRTKKRRSRRSLRTVDLMPS